MVCGKLVWLYKKFLSLIKESGDFYRHAYQYNGQNSTADFQYQTVFKMFLQLLEQRKGSPLTKEEIFSADFNCCGATAITAKWAVHGFQESVEEMAEMLRNVIPVSIMKYLLY